MPSKVYNNVEGHRLLDNGVVCEDVNKVDLPTLSHPTSKISASGMAMDIEMPDTTHLEAMEIAVAHNNGVNCHLLAAPGRHNLELRIVRQCYNKVSGEIEHKSVKVRTTCVHKSTEKGSVEIGNPLGSTEKYSILRYEEIMDGETIVLIDVDKIEVNGVSYTDPVEKLLN